MGLAFFLIGTTKLTGAAHTVEYFAVIGWGQWGTIALTCSVGTAALLSLTALRGNPVWGGFAMVLEPIVLTSLTIALAWLTWPPRRV